MDSTARAVERLTTEHTELIDGAVGASGPLLELLREARYPNLGRTMGGAGSGGMLDMQAIALYEAIDAGVRAWLDHYRQHHTGELIPLVTRLHEILQTEHAGGRLEDPDRMLGMFTTWVQRIEEYFDPPHEHELTVACPDCGEEHAMNSDGERKRAVRVQVKPGRALIAECFSCGMLWAGEQQLTELAEVTGVDVDWVALRAFADTPTRALENAPTLE